MATQPLKKKNTKLRSQGLKGLITAASLAATIGGWGALSISEAQTGTDSGQVAIASDSQDQVALATPTPPSVAQSNVPQRSRRRGGRFGQIPGNQAPSTGGTQQGDAPTPMATTRSSR